MIRKKLVQIGGSKAIIIPSSYLDYWQMKGKEIHEFGMEINRKIVLEPIFTDVPKQEPKEG